MQSDLWRSERLVYRGVEKDDDAFLATMEADSEAFINSSHFMPVPRSKKTTEGLREWLAEKSMMGCLVCLPAADAPDSTAKATPVGFISLAAGHEPQFLQHRHSEIGVSIARAYQGNGYGGEAIRWALRWGFRRAGFHRIAIGAFGWNAGAIRLYERLGFKLEGRKRDFLWYDGEWHDMVELAMLEDEWKELYGNKKTIVAPESQ